ncbi:alpha/beta hydrolase [bacterium]|nr:alpha/beta hydrolase [bacterium]
MDAKIRWFALEEVRLHARVWLPEVEDASKPIFLLYHGLSSNSLTWKLVAERLASAGYPVIAVDQRGHGPSDKPESGYDFATVAGEVRQVIEQLAPRKVILAGQSWGGNVMLEVAARYPGVALGYVFVDGGFLNLRGRGSWEQVSQALRPPALVGLRRTALAERISQMHPEWVPDGVEMTLGNLETLPDGTVRPWLSLDRHMQILRAIYDQDVASLFPKVQEPVLICPAEQGPLPVEEKRQLVQAAANAIPQAEVVWFHNTAHDIHVDRPDELANAMLAFANRLDSAA